MLAMNHDSCTRKIIQMYFQKRHNALPKQSKRILVVCIQKSISPLSIAAYMYRKEIQNDSYLTLYK